MGHFYYNCAVSGLPIVGGTPVRFLILASSPYAEPGNACTSFDWWAPRTFPIRAKYDEYGSIEDVQGELGKTLCLEGLKKDLITQGWGDNSVHDVPTSTDMGWDEFLGALREGRVKVGDRGGDRTMDALERIEKLLGKSGQEHVKENMSPKPPTLENVTECLKDLPSWGGSFASGGFLVDDHGPGIVRVRWEGIKERSERLAEALPRLAEKYAAVITAGTPGYSSEDQIMVMPKPGTYWPDPIDSRDSILAPMMIREDVWQAMLSLPLSDGSFSLGNREEPHTPDDYKKAVHAFYEEELAWHHHLDSLTVLDRSREVISWNFGEYQRDEFLWAIRSGYTSMNGLKLKMHWDLLLEKKLPKEEVSEVLDDLGEFLYVMTSLLYTRHLWQPSTGAGSQTLEWDKHAMLLTACAKIASKEYEEDQIED